jgi:hypothetical protein
MILVSRKLKTRRVAHFQELELTRKLNIIFKQLSLYNQNKERSSLKIYRRKERSQEETCIYKQIKYKTKTLTFH